MSTRVSDNIRRFNHLSGEIDTVYHNAALKLGLSDSAMQILYTICNFGERCLLSDICRLSGTSKQTINSALRKLEGSDIVRLEAVNHRAKSVILTEKGKALAEKTALLLIRAENEIFDSWKPEEVRQYLALTERFLAEMKEKTTNLQEFNFND